MTVLISDVTNALQKVIMPFIRDNLPKETILLDQLKRNTGVSFMNNYFYAPIRTARHGGVAALATDDSSTISGKSQISQASVGVKIMTGSFDISKLVIDATKTTKGAVENMLTHNAETLASDFARSVNRQYFSDGYGIIGKVRASGGSVGEGTAAIELPDSSTDDGAVASDVYGTINGDINPMKYFATNQVVGFGSVAADVGTISSVTGSSIVVTGAPAIAANDAVYILDGSGIGGGSAEIEGLRRAMPSSTSGSYAGIATTTAGWQRQFGSVAEALTLGKMEDMYLSAKEYGYNSDRYAIFVNKTLYKKYGSILTAMRRVVNETELLGGWTGLEFAAGAGKVGVFLDYDVPDGECLIVNLDTWTICQVSDIDWMDGDSASTMLRRASKITYQATMVWFTNLLCLCPAANARLTQKTD